MATPVLPQAQSPAGGRPLHVLFTVNAAWNLWNFRRPLITALLADGHELTLLAPRDETVDRLEALGCRFIDLEMDQKGLNPLRDARLALRIRRHLAAIRPDAVLGFTIKNNLYGAWAARSLGIPLVPNVTGLGTAFLSGGLLEGVAGMLYRASFAKLPRVFFQNEDDLALFVSRGLVRPSQARRLPGSGIDLDHFRPAPWPDESRGITFLMIARLLRDKGVREYVDAARIVRARFPKARFQLLGAADAANRSAIAREELEAWQREGAIEYLGTRDDVRKVIASSHCVVLPSYREGAPRTLIEAAAMARPVIASDVPGCRSVLSHGVNGFLCEVRSGESLARACLAYLEMGYAGRQRMGVAGRDKMEREFSQDLVIEAYRKVLADLARPVRAIQ